MTKLISAIGSMYIASKRIFCLVFFGFFLVFSSWAQSDDCYKEIPPPSKRAQVKCLILKLKDNSVPEALFDCVNLRKLEIKGKDISFNEKGWERLDSLQSLTIANLGLKKIPDFVFGLSSLQMLDIDRNPIEMWDQRLTQLTNLSDIEAWSTQILYIPGYFLQIPELQIVNLRNNPFSPGDQERWQKKFPHIKFFFSARCHCG